MTVLMGVAACEGPPVFEYEGVEEYAGQDVTEVEPGFEEPSSDDEGEIPLPLGFTAESWKEFLLEKVDEGIVVEYGGLDVVVATMDRPLVYDGLVPTVRFVALGEDEMDALGVEPGDHAPGSTAMDKRIYIYAPEADPSNIDSTVAGKTSSKGADDIFWSDKVGSPLAFCTDSSIAIYGCADYGTSGPLWPWLFSDRRGIARFYGYWTNETRDVQVRYPSTPCPWSSWRTTVYAQAYSHTFWFGTIYFWIVPEPAVWIAVGQDGWDSIKLIGDKYAQNDPLEIRRVFVTNNNKPITSSAAYSSTVVLKAPPDSHNLVMWINYYKWSRVFYSGNNVVQWAASDYAQAASVKYPVYPHPSPWHGHTVPYDWCTEFASWAFRTGAPGKYPNLPIATTVEPNIGVKEFYDWGKSEGGLRLPLEFGQDEFSNPLIINGPTYTDWAGLATGVKEGDYLARREERPSTATPICHSMIVVGWLKDDGTDVGSSYFDPDRRCNRVLVVDGNVGGVSSPGTEGLGSTANVSTRVVCRQVEDTSGFSIDPDCDIDGDGIPNEHGERCNVRLWDTLSDGDPPKSSFFIDMSY